MSFLSSDNRVSNHGDLGREVGGADSARGTGGDVADGIEEMSFGGAGGEEVDAGGVGDSVSRGSVEGEGGGGDAVDVVSIAIS